MRASLYKRITILVFILMTSLATHAGAQRISRSPLATRMKGRIGPRPDTTETGQAKAQAVVPLIAPVVVQPPPIPAEPPKARYSFNLGPNVTSDHSDWEAGIGVSFANDSLVHWPPFELEVADGITSAESTTHNVLSLSATVQPIPDISLKSASISFYLLGSFQHTAGASDDAQGVGEIDFTVIDPDYGEYDFRNDFDGEDSFLGKVEYELPTPGSSSLGQRTRLAPHGR